MTRQQTVRRLIFSGIVTVAVLSVCPANRAQQSQTAASSPGELTVDRIFRATFAFWTPKPRPHVDARW